VARIQKKKRKFGDPRTPSTPTVEAFPASSGIGRKKRDRSAGVRGKKGWWVFLVTNLVAKSNGFTNQIVVHTNPERYVIENNTATSVGNTRNDITDDGGGVRDGDIASENGEPRGSNFLKNDVRDDREFGTYGDATVVSVTKKTRRLAVLMRVGPFRKGPAHRFHETWNANLRGIKNKMEVGITLVRKLRTDRSYRTDVVGLIDGEDLLPRATFTHRTRGEMIDLMARTENLNAANRRSRSFRETTESLLPRDAEDRDTEADDRDEFSKKTISPHEDILESRRGYAFPEPRRRGGFMYELAEFARVECSVRDLTPCRCFSFH
jgi:hypothetical protein